jgi:predicted membrane chloride channel (bestrophin family)
MLNWVKIAVNKNQLRRIWLAVVTSSRNLARKTITTLARKLKLVGSSRNFSDELE